MAMRVSMSGGWMSVIRPHWKREHRRSSSLAISLGGRSELMTICLFALCSVLKVLKNSSCVAWLLLMNYTSSIKRMSTLR